MHEPVAIFKPHFGWRLGQLILGVGFCVTGCFLPLGLWFLWQALWTKVEVYPDRIIRTPFKWLGTRGYPLSQESRVGLGRVYSDEEESSGPDHWLVLHTPGKPIIWFNIEGYPTPRPLAVHVALQTGKPLYPVVECGGWLRVRFRFTDE